MSVSLTGSCLSPSSSLPSVRSLVSASEAQIASALQNLRALYCPVRLPTIISTPISRRDQKSITSPPAPVDSGYASQDEDDDDEENTLEDVVTALRADPFERTFATQWLNALLARSEEMSIDEHARERITDDAAFILSSLFEFTDTDEEDALTRDFSFSTFPGEAIGVTLNDAPLSSSDHTAVGLQSWGASIVLSSMMCADPKRFALDPSILTSAPDIIELGAGTGLVSLVLAKLLPTIGIFNAKIAATDYHHDVLENCKLNIENNFPSSGSDVPSPVTTAVLDWSQPPPDLRASSNLLVASDVVYAPEHAAWLRDCAAHLLTPKGNFWLMVTVRQTGKFEGIPDTVESAFALEKCPRSENGMVFCILETKFVQKRRGIGRGDETGYNLYRIGWA